MNSPHWTLTAPVKISPRTVLSSRDPTRNSFLLHSFMPFFHILKTIKKNAIVLQWKLLWMICNLRRSQSHHHQAYLVHFVELTQSSRSSSFWVKQNWKTHICGGFLCTLAIHIHLVHRVSMKYPHNVHALWILNSHFLFSSVTPLSVLEDIAFVWLNGTSIKTK